MTVQVAGYYTTSLKKLETPQTLARQLRRADDFIRLGIVATHEILKSLQIKQLDPETTGLILGTSFGPMETNFDVLDQVVHQDPTSPTLFSHSVFNATAGYLATTFGLKGSALTITDFAFPFYTALQQALLALNSGRLKRCLVLHVETYSNLLQDARASHDPEIDFWPAGVVCWLLAAGDADAGADRWTFSSLEVNLNEADKSDYLPFREDFVQDGHTTKINDPLGSSFSITKAITEQQGNALHCSVTAAHGSVNLRLQKQI